MVKPSVETLDLFAGRAENDPSKAPDIGDEAVSKPYYVYRHYDTCARLLYVGSTDDPNGRLRDHLRESRWASKIASVTVERFASEQKAITAERSAILDEHPLYNKHRVPVKREVKVPFQARLPESLWTKLAWLTAVLPGGPSMQQLLLAGTEQYIDQLIAAKANSENVTVDELYDRMDAQMRGQALKK